MAPSRTSTVKSKHAASKSGIRNSKAASAKHVPDGIVKARSSKSKKTVTQGVSLKQQRKVRTKTGDLPGKGNGDGGLVARLKKKFGKGRRVYTEKELGVQALNMITPVGVEKPKGGKKGKVFVDDRESMMTILAMVNADKEGQIESKMMKARQMEEIREARKVEQDKKFEDRKRKLDETKEGLRKKRRRSAGDAGGEEVKETKGTKPLKARKRVSFA